MSTSSKSNILVVDDTPANLNLLGAILKNEGYVVRKLPCGQLALNAIATEPPDLILLDVKMPSMDGYEVCKKLQADPAVRDIPVIFISALQETTDKIQAFSAGGTDYITKPFQAEEVLARVATHLRIHHLQQALLQAKEQAEQAQEQAESANRAKSAFLANMSHELRTPLNAIQGFTQILLRDSDLSSDKYQKLQSIQRGSDYLLTLINDILDLAKIEAGRFELFPEVWDTHEFFKELTAMFRIRAEQKEIAFQYKHHNSLPKSLYSDDKRLRQIVMNLVGNAIKFTEQGCVTLTAKMIENQLTLEISDTGIGIPAEKVVEIFKPFQQTGSTAHKRQGTGLGLAITQKLINNMAGEIKLESTPGKGSCFHIKVPVEPVSTLIEANPYQKDMPQVIGYKRQQGEGAFRVLIVDDVPSNREVLSLLLKPLGFDVREVENGKQCLEVIQTWASDIILLDLHMPGIDGFEVAQTLQKSYLSQNTPIIAISASAFAEDRIAALSAGCKAHLSKPVNFNELLDNLSRFLPLDWNYLTTEQTEGEGIHNPAKNIHLSRKQARELMDFVLLGDIEAIENFALKLKDDMHYLPLAKQIASLVETFEIAALRELAEAQQAIHQQETS
ncbi:response regulator [Candidatus Venteria ishoeyi]|uniref:Sensory/regulatory protein RpfC n=1 Tax=Candidatus Venteria ishoeyi TaxID=1899563 RepID=A0A1H6FJC7_9GAMM|nr:response regulator [Candidatus Venteria ishoeyi]MDM8548111.1 response regulator [Candidatus Venteria ishoeyi]SEH09196.1 Aerobic respiration control sensor protein ArcB [Candidatus Venteria ishoeyi]SEH09321.1 Aerobic respiration control sensor protein ArcB [Candidatus Venteria ishoeyi]